MLLGDFNAQVGSRPDVWNDADTDEWHDVRVPRGFGKVNDAGKELLSFLSMNQSTICNTWFVKNPMYLQSWQHPKMKKWHAIDFIITHQRDRRFCKDCRVISSADCGSDHRLVCLTFRLPHANFYRQSSTPKRFRFDASLFQPSAGMSTEDKAAILERVLAYQDSVPTNIEKAPESSTVEAQWCSIKDSLICAGKEHLGYARRSQPDWFSANQDVLLPLFKERRLCYQQWMKSKLESDYTKFRVARSKARLETRRAKNRWLEGAAQQAELGRVSFNGGSAWKAIRSIQRCFQGLKPMSTLTVKNEDGTLCKSVEEQSRRWQRHFAKVLNIESAYDETVFGSLCSRPVQKELDDLP